MASSPLIRPWVVVAAAGNGTRMAGALSRPKQFFLWEGIPLYRHAALALSRSARIAGIVFVLPENVLQEEEARMRFMDDLDPAESALHDSGLRKAPLGLPWKAVAGGSSRRNSVYNGLRALPPTCEFVLIHDAARPFVSPALVENLIDALAEGVDGVIPGLPISDTVKKTCDGRILTTLDRDSLCAVQTPQAFRLDRLLSAHEAAPAQMRTATDDAALLEHMGYNVRIIPGEATNRKITTPEDLPLRRDTPAPLPCTGYGYDVHRYGGARPMKLGGILIPNAPGIAAHSDGDTLLHALMDAVLSCACLGDIGRLFPDTDPKLKNINSAVLLGEALRLASEAGIRIIQADCTLIAQIPRIAPHAPAIRRNLARLLNLDERKINIKATTEEGLGFTGAKEGIKAVALVSALREPA